jgi:AGCS family alanine or glycine:cation symporter
MWTAAFFGMIIKYCEIFLAIKHQNERKQPENNKYNYAPMNYIIKGTGSRILASLFAFFCIITSFLMGNMTQVNAISATLSPASGINPLIIDIICSGFIAFLLTGGLKSVFKFIEKAVPIMSLFYLLSGLIVIIINYSQIIPAFLLILKTAFLPLSAVGGIAGAGIAKAIQEGIAKGAFSNEAGMGSGSLAHGSCKEKKPEAQGLWGAFEVFADTIVISGVTAFIVLTSGVWVSGGSNGVYSAFNMSFGIWGGWFTAICIFLFAVTSIISWEYFGECCINYLFDKYKIKNMILFYRLIFIFFIFIGSVVNSNLIWILSEISNTCMIFINMSGVLSLKNEFFNVLDGHNYSINIHIHKRTQRIKNED